MTSLAFTLLTCLTCAASAAAQDPEQVIKDFKDGCKPLIAGFKDTLASDGDNLQAVLDDFAARFDELATQDEPVDELATGLENYLGAVKVHQAFVHFDIGTLAGTAQGDLTPGGAGENVYPQGIVIGDGGVLDDAEADVQKAIDKAFASFGKKLAKLAKKLRKQTDMRLAVVLRAPPSRLIVPVDSTFTTLVPDTLSIDLVMGFDRGSEDDDGRFWLAGGAVPGDGDVEMALTGPSFTADSVTPNQQERWSFETLSDFKEGNYEVVVQQSDGAKVGARLGLE